MLKLLANSTSYGIFAELNVQSYDRPKPVVCYGAEDQEFATGTKSVEEAGTHFHPLLATLITGAARLMLALPSVSPPTMASAGRSAIRIAWH